MSAEFGKDLQPSEQNGNRLRAAADLSEAANLIEKIGSPYTQEKAKVKVSIALALCGQEPISTPDQFIKGISIIYDPKKFDIEDARKRIALLRMAVGQSGEALVDLVAQRYRSYRDFGNLAMVASQKGLDSSVPLELAWRALRNDEPLFTGRVATLHRKLLGEVPINNLGPLHRMTSKERGQWGNDRRVGLSKVYAKAGYPKEALRIWEETSADSAYGREYAVAIADIALAFAEQKIDPTVYLEKGRQKIERIRTTKDYEPSYHQAEIYAKLGRAAAVFGFEYKPYFDVAFEKAAKVDSNLEIDAFIEIAAMQLGASLNASETIKKAKAGVEKYFPEDGIPEWDKVSILKDFYLWQIFRLELREGNYEGARQYLNWLVDHLETKEKDFTIAEKAVALAELAQTEYFGNYAYVVDDEEFSPFDP